MKNVLKKYMNISNFCYKKNIQLKFLALIKKIFFN